MFPFFLQPTSICSFPTKLYVRYFNSVWQCENSISWSIHTQRTLMKRISYRISQQHGWSIFVTWDSDGNGKTSIKSLTKLAYSSLLIQSIHFFFPFALTSTTIFQQLVSTWDYHFWCMWRLLWHLICYVYDSELWLNDSGLRDMSTVPKSSFEPIFEGDFWNVISASCVWLPCDYLGISSSQAKPKTLMVTSYESSHPSDDEQPEKFGERQRSCLSVNSIVEKSTISPLLSHPLSRETDEQRENRNGKKGAL